MTLSSLQQKLTSGQFVVTAEVAPPKGCDMGSFLHATSMVAPYVDAVNVTDNQGANMRMTPLIGAALLVREGIEPIMQLTCRDRNRLALQSDLLGAAAAGVRNILALTGDDIGCGDHRQAKAVFDLDSVLLLQTLQDMNTGYDMAGAALNGTVDFFCGAAAAPEAEPFAATQPKLAKKAAAGARFFQTQAVFDSEKLSRFTAVSHELGVKVIVGILVLRSAKMAEFINRAIPGLNVPPHLVERLANARNQSEEGQRIAIETAVACRDLCDGVHIMTMGRDDCVARIVDHLK